MLIKVLQINVNRIRASHDVVTAVVEGEKIDITAVSEPNKNYIKKAVWFADIKEDAAIYLKNRKLKVDEVRGGEGFTWIQFKELLFVSAYASPNADIDDFQQQLEKIGDVLKEKEGPKLIIGDFNAKSPQRGSMVHDNREKRMTEWMAQQQLIAINQSSILTFCRGEYESFLDLTLAAEEIASKIKNWKVLEEKSLSDHSIITFEIEVKDVKNYSGPRGKVLDLTRFEAKWREIAEKNQEALTPGKPGRKTEHAKTHISREMEDHKRSRIGGMKT